MSLSSTYPPSGISLGLSVSTQTSVPIEYGPCTPNLHRLLFLLLILQGPPQPPVSSSSFPVSSISALYPLRWSLSPLGPRSRWVFQGRAGERWVLWGWSTPRWLEIEGTFSRGAWAKMVHSEKWLVWKNEEDCLRKRLSKQSTIRVWEDRGGTQWGLA